MPYTATGKDLMLNALAGTNPAAPITHMGLFDAGAAVSAGVTATASTDNINKTGHGLSNGDLIVFSSLTGGAGLVVGRPYYVVGSAANTFQVALKPGGAVVDITTDYTAATYNKLVELSGGSPAYARKTIAFAASGNGLMDDSTNGANVHDVPGGVNVDYVGYFSAVTAGTLQAIDDVTRETFAGQGTYTVTDAKLDLLTGV